MTTSPDNGKGSDDTRDPDFNARRSNWLPRAKRCGDCGSVLLSRDKKIGLYECVTCCKTVAI